MWWGERGIRRRPARRSCCSGSCSSVLLGVDLPRARRASNGATSRFTPAADAYGSLYFTVTGFHMLHVVVGLVMLAMLLVWTLLGYFGERRHSDGVDRGDVLALRHRGLDRRVPQLLRRTLARSDERPPTTAPSSGASGAAPRPHRRGLDLVRDPRRRRSPGACRCSSIRRSRRTAAIRTTCRSRASIWRQCPQRDGRRRARRARRLRAGRTRRHGATGCARARRSRDARTTCSKAATGARASWRWSA